MCSFYHLWTNKHFRLWTNVLCDIVCKWHCRCSRVVTVKWTGMTHPHLSKTEMRRLGCLDEKLCFTGSIPFPLLMGQGCFLIWTSCKEYRILCPWVVSSSLPSKHTVLILTVAFSNDTSRNPNLTCQFVHSSVFLKNCSVSKLSTKPNKTTSVSWCFGQLTSSLHSSWCCLQTWGWPQPQGTFLLDNAEHVDSGTATSLCIPWSTKEDAEARASH